MTTAVAAVLLNTLLTECPIPMEVITGDVATVAITGVTSDSREVMNGSVFVALVGERTDGHQYLQQAADKGAAVVVVQQNRLCATELPKGVVVLATDNTYAVLGYLASGFYGHPGKVLNLVGVTGTNGKTTVTHLLAAMLQQAGMAYGLMGTLGVATQGKQDKEAKNTVTAHTTLMAPQMHAALANMHQDGLTHVVMEVSSHALDQFRVAGCEYNVAIHTNVTQDHLDYHRTMARYAAAKAVLFAGLKPGAKAVINVDDEWAGTMQQACGEGVEQLTYGIHTEHNVTFRATHITYSLRGTTFTLVHPQGDTPVTVKLAGEFGVYNVLAALAGGVALGLPLAQCLAAIQEMPGVRGRFERVADEPVVIVDYAHTPDGLENVLETARAILPRGSRLITVFGCGGDRDATKRPKMGAIAARLSHIIVATSDNPRTEDPQQIITDVVHGIDAFDGERMHVQVDRRAAIRLALDLAEPNDMVVVAGKGHEDYQILGTQTIHFDDREEVQVYLAEQPN